MRNINVCLKTIVLTVLMVVACQLASLVPALAATGAVSAQSEACEAIGSGTDCKDSQGVSIDDIVTVVINIFSVIIGIVAVVMIIIAGFKYISSSGDSNKVASAKNTIIYAIVGLIIVVMAQAIVQYVIKGATTSPKKKATSYAQMMTTHTRKSLYLSPVNDIN